MMSAFYRKRVSAVAALAVAACVNMGAGIVLSLRDKWDLSHQAFCTIQEKRKRGGFPDRPILLLVFWVPAKVCVAILGAIALVSSLSEVGGTANVTVTLKDDGGTVNGGADTSPPQTFKIAVNFVNDAPSFTAGPDVTERTPGGWGVRVV